MKTSSMSPRDVLRVGGTVLVIGAVSSAGLAAQEFVGGRSGTGASATVVSVLAAASAVWLFSMSRRVAPLTVVEAAEGKPPSDAVAVAGWMAVAAVMGGGAEYLLGRTTGAVFGALLSAVLLGRGALTTRQR
jgi:hypothetical protein